MTGRLNFDQAPMVVIWEASQACDLECIHCRASAQPDRHPQELSTAEAKVLLDEVRRFGQPLMVFTGGDPMKRPDLLELMDYSSKIGLRTNVSPSATPLLTREMVRNFQSVGVARMAISLDGPDEKSHDEFRGVQGTFTRAMEALDEAMKIGLETQLQTTVTRHNMNRLWEIAQIVDDVKGRMWSAFFLIVTGRALSEYDLKPEEYEQVFEVLYQASKKFGYDVKTTEAMHYRRYVAQRRKQEGISDKDSNKVIWRTAGVSDAKGFVFISHLGEVFPSGFLAVSAGNVRKQSLVDIYRNADLFKVLRDMDARGGKCGYCEYKNICGGSRARAWALTGDYLAEDPNCTYQPDGSRATALA